MQELVGRLSALDPESGEGLKVIGYFDTLIAASAGADAVLRGAAVLTGAVAGASWPGGGLRVAPDGRRLDPRPDLVAEPGWPARPAADAHVWVERQGPAHANDALVVERCALALSLVRHRHHERTLSPVAVLVDGERPAAEREAMAVRRRLGARVRVVAHPAERAVAGSSVVLATEHGPVRAAVVGPGDPPGDLSGPVGRGTWGGVLHLPRSWAEAQLALRVGRARGGAVDAEELGALLEAADALDRRATPHPDVDALHRLDPRSLEVLDAVVESDSLRQAAATLGMHHSSLASRRGRLAEELGYDPGGPLGGARYRVARVAHLLRVGTPAPPTG
ncbi:hypothetical protein [Phycicoccus duodecadis]|uniref:PucR-like helix-turn-helix protein n=1 Tax=Phycicoccus duodecadis TaxID=173053 RepID=A0A2N3YKY4_9MICO|nr:hypothetical protein [Phycicoccus duodecadis]PKW27521.1 hypothetical protein ATL31_2367 [Phycicoccus duodecadis]